MPPPESNPRPPDDDSPIQGKNWLTMQAVVFLGAITPKCTEVTRLHSQGLDRPLPWLMRLRLRLHQLMCCYCARYGRQLRSLRSFRRSLPEHLDEIVPECLEASVKARLKQRLREAR